MVGGGRTQAQGTHMIKISETSRIRFHYLGPAAYRFNVAEGGMPYQKTVEWIT